MREANKSTTKDIIQDRPREIGRRVKLSAEMNDRELALAERVRQIAIAYGRARKAAARKNGGSK